MPQTAALLAFPPASALPASTDGDDIFTVGPADLDGGVFDGGLGSDTLQLTEGGSFDLTLPQVFAGIETVAGSDQHDTIILDQERFSGIAAFDGGVFDFRAKLDCGCY